MVIEERCAVMTVKEETHTENYVPHPYDPDLESSVFI